LAGWFKKINIFFRSPGNLSIFLNHPVKPENLVVVDYTGPHPLYESPFQFDKKAALIKKRL